jgi:predicted DNA-binding transcriptional regulator
MQTQKFKASEIIKELEQEVGVFFERLEQELKQRNP